MTTLEATCTPDPAQVEAFSGRLIGWFNGAALALMTSIGHQTGLWEAMAGSPPATADAIAARTGLSERYVREWLAAMVVGDVVRHDPSTGVYWLPSEHAACLTHAAGPNNLATVMQMIAMLGEVEQPIVEAFRHGRGVPYSKFPRFHCLMAEDSGQVMDATLLDRTLPTVPGLVERLREGIDVLDLGCGHGHALVLMASQFPRSRFVGIDIAQDALAAGRAEASRRGLTNLRFEEIDAAQLDHVASYDFVTTFDAIHDQAVPLQVLQAIHRALRPGGVYLMVEIAASSHVHDNCAHPFAPALYTISTMHCMSVSLAAGGEGLGAMWGDQKAREYLSTAGFEQVEVHRVEGDMFNNYYVARR